MLAHEGTVVLKSYFPTTSANAEERDQALLCTEKRRLEPQKEPVRPIAYEYQHVWFKIPGWKDPKGIGNNQQRNRVIICHVLYKNPLL